MYLLDRNTQVNFKTNKELLDQAKEVMASHNLDMSKSFNLFLENIVENQSLPFALEEDKEKEAILAELRSDIQKSFDDLENGRVSSLSEVREYLGL